MEVMEGADCRITGAKRKPGPRWRGGGGGLGGRIFDLGVKSTLTVTARGGKWRVNGYLVSLYAPLH